MPSAGLLSTWSSEADEHQRDHVDADGPVWWLRLGISIERIKPRHPEQNGRHERRHLTLKKEALRNGVKVPVVYANVLLDNGRAFSKLGATLVTCPKGEGGLIPAAGFTVR